MFEKGDEVKVTAEAIKEYDLNEDGVKALVDAKKDQNLTEATTEFISTHPNHHHRIQEMKKLVEGMKSDCLMCAKLSGHNSEEDTK